MAKNQPQIQNNVDLTLNPYKVCYLYSLNFAETLTKKGRLTFSYTHVDGFYPKPKFQTDQKLNASGANLDAKPAKINTSEDSYDHNNFLQTDLPWQRNKNLGKLLAFFTSLFSASLPITDFLICYQRKYKKVPRKLEKVVAETKITRPKPTFKPQMAIKG